MKYMTLLILTALILMVGCGTENGESQSVDAAKAQELVVSPEAPISKGGDDSELHKRYTLSARFGGKLLVRVREPLLAPDPQLLGKIPGFISSEPSPWADSDEIFRSDGLAQRVLELSDEDVTSPLAIEVRVIHLTGPEEMVRVQLWLYRGDKEEPWLDFYQCRPQTRTTRASSTAHDGVAVMESGKSIMMCSYAFGGDTGELQVPLDNSGMQWIAVEFGWISNLDLTR